MQMTRPPATARSRVVLTTIGVVVAFVLGGIVGGVLGAAARDSVGTATLAEARAALENCQAREIVSAHGTDLLAEAFDALADEDPVTAVNKRVAASEYLNRLDEEPPCSFDD
jgi:hypothetical protein